MAGAMRGMLSSITAHVKYLVADQKMLFQIICDLQAALTCAPCTVSKLLHCIRRLAMAGWIAVALNQDDAYPRQCPEGAITQSILHHSLETSQSPAAATVPLQVLPEHSPLTFHT